jgi:hypothetical protein
LAKCKELIIQTEKRESDKAGKTSISICRLNKLLSPINNEENYSLNLKMLLSLK